MEQPATNPQRQWFIVSRWQDYEGESRANLLRVLAIVVFYGVQLYQRSTASSAASLEFHRQATLIAVAWSLIALAVYVCLQRRVFPALLKYVVTAADVALLTSLAVLAGGPTSPATNLYFLILGLTALRASVGLTWFTTLACLLGYLTLVAKQDKTWFDADHATPMITQLMMFSSLTLMGVIIGQVVRQYHKLAIAYADRLAAGGRS